MTSSLENGKMAKNQAMVNIFSMAIHNQDLKSKQYGTRAISSAKPQYNTQTETYIKAHYEISKSTAMDSTHSKRAVISKAHSTRTIPLMVSQNIKMAKNILAV